MYRNMTGLRTAGWHLLALSALLVFLTASAFAKDSVPDWVRAAAAQTLPVYPPETRAVVLLDETTYTVSANGRATEHDRRVVKILRPQGRNEGVVHVNFDKDTRILSLHVWSIGPDGHEYVVKDNEFADTSFGEGNLYSDMKYRVVHAPGSDPGGVIAYDYTQEMRPYAAETDWFFQEDIPHLKQSFTLELPPGFTHEAVWAHHAPVKEIDLESMRWRWEMNDVPAVDLDHLTMTPSLMAMLGRMSVSYSGPGLAYSTHGGTWQGIGEWYADLSKDRLGSDPAIEAKARELTAGKTDFYDKAEAIGEFIQTQIRYFAIEMGIGGNQPHFAADIYRNHYGDCKDKATLLSAMLSSVGVHSALMMVDHRRGFVDPDAPSIYGDHMIAAIEVPQGYTSPKLRSLVSAKNGKRYLIFDPTWEKTPFGQLESNLQGSYGVLVEGDASQIVRLPVLAPQFNFISRTASFQLDAGGELKGAITERRFGDVSEHRRGLYTSGTAQQQTEFLDRVLRQDFTTFTVSDFKVENAAALNKDLTMSYSVQADGYGKKMGTLLMVRPRVVGSEGLRVDHKERKVPIDLGETLLVTDDYSIQLPAGYAIDEIPDPVKMDVGFAAYESSSKVTGNVLRYTRTYTVREVTLSPEKYPDLQRLAGVIAADEAGKAVLKKQ